MPDMPNLTVDVPHAHVSHTWETTRCPLITLWNATWRRANTEPKDDLLIEHGHLRVPQQIEERYIYIYIPGPANGQKKNVVLVNDPVFSQLTYFGSDRAIQPKRPKMAEIWLKSNFLCVSMVSQSHNFTFFHHSYTCSTDWPLTCLTGSMGSALSGLSPRSAFSFILRRVGALFRDWMPIGINFNAVWHVLFRFWLANLYHLRQLCVCLRVGLHAYNYLIGVIHNT